MIVAGSIVEALRDGGVDQNGLPFERPIKGRRYIIGDTYEMPYGLGCTLEGLDPAPYRGYFLHRRGNGKLSGWWFKEVDIGDEIMAIARKAKT